MKNLRIWEVGTNNNFLPMISKALNKICMFLLVVTLLSFSSAQCSQNQFFNGVDLDSGKINYPVAGGVYYSQSPCFVNDLTGNLVITNLSIGLNNSIIYYPDSTRIGLVDFFDNTSLFYFYLEDNVTLSEVYSMSGIGNYSFKTNFSYLDNKLASVNNYFSNDLLFTSVNFNYSSDEILVYGNDSIESFNILDGKIVNRTQTGFNGESLVSLTDYFSYFENKTIVVEKYNNSIVGGLVYDKLTQNISLDCYDFDEEYGDNSTNISALVSFGGNFSYDSCQDNQTLIENYCGYNFRWDFWNMELEPKSFIQTCQYGCDMGRCLTAEEINEPVVLDLPDEPPVVQYFP